MNKKLLLLVCFSVLCMMAQAQQFLGNSQELKQKLAASAPVNGRSSGTTLPIKVSKNVTLEANVNSVQGNSFVGGINGKSGADFFMRFDGNEVTGNIVLRNEKKAYQFSSDANGNTYVSSVDINDVICIEYNTRDVSHERSSSPAAKEAAANNLQSLPGAPGCVLLDFDGEYVSGTPWNSGNPINAAPSGMSDAAITEAWELVSEDFRPFRLNVTTDVNVFNTYPKNRRMRCIFTPTNTAAPGAGGVAYISSFSWNDDTPCWVFILSGKSGGEAASHEIGHTLSLGHDGRTSPSEGYYRGHGDWAPIMGVGYYEPISQWSKGEYANANNKEDDLTKMTSANFGFGYRVDDHSNSTASATLLKSDAAGNVTAANNFGVIERTTDVDYFYFNTGAGTVTLNFNTVSRHGNLDILARLHNSSGTVIGTYNPAGLNASMNVSLSAGQYYISIDGTGVGDPATNGYSDYASLGSFFISGKIVPSVVVPSVVTVYQHCNYATNGYGVGLPVGNYTTAQLNNAGVGNNDISSIKVQSGYEIVVYDGDNFTGNARIFRSDVSCLVSFGLNDVPSSVIVRIASPNQAPTVSITAPANNATYTAPATITINANATDIDGDVTSVNFYNGSTLIGSDNTSPYSVTWSNVAAGSYNITAVATDNNGATKTSSVIVVKVNAVGNNVPTVSLTSPSNGATFTAPASVTISANASDSDGSIVSVAFYNGSTLISSDNTAPYSITWSNVAAGTYSITARATDNLGAVGSSGSVSITVSNPSGGCSGIPTYSENGGYVAGSRVQNVGSLYECKPWPFSGWCNGASWAYGPGTGMYWGDAWVFVRSCSGSKIDKNESANVIMNSPNPFSSSTELTIQLEEAGEVEIQVTDALGRVVLSPYNGYMPAGENTITLEMSEFNSGVYYCRINTAGQIYGNLMIKK